MENFLHLVPTIATDYEASEALVYGDDDEASDAVAYAPSLSDQLQRHVFSSTTNSSSDSTLEALALAERLADPDERERLAYLTRADALEAHMEQVERELQQRLDAMARILALSDPLEQLSEYMALKLDERSDDDPVGIAAELVECSRRLTNRADSEIALLGAFFFSCDAPCPKTRGVASVLPVVAAMIESGDGAPGASLEHPIAL